MSVVRIPPTLRADTDGEREVIAVGDTVRDLLDDLMARFPTLDGKLEYANVYVGGEDIRTPTASKHRSRGRHRDPPAGDGRWLLPRVAASLLDLVGNTPLVELKSEGDVRLYAKLEGRTRPARSRTASRRR